MYLHGNVTLQSPRRVKLTMSNGLLLRKVCAAIKYWVQICYTVQSLESKEPSWVCARVVQFSLFYLFLIRVYSRK